MRKSTKKADTASICEAWQISKITKNQLFVTEPFLPPLDGFVQYLEGIWQRKILTNQGPLLRELEDRLADYLQVPRVCGVSNAGLGLQLVFRALKLTGEVITTPFSYAATSSCLIWEGLKPVFVDICPETFGIDAGKVESAITDETTAILATHVFGYPCDVVGLEQVARRNRLKLIFDTAHGFGVKYRGQDLASYGDASVLSFHATKLFHSCEGGGVVARDRDVQDSIEWMRRYGHDGPERFHGVGINAKLSELHAALGLCMLDNMSVVLENRKRVHDLYCERIASNSQIQIPSPPDEATNNYAYFPVLLSDENSLLKTVATMNQDEVFPRRYFHPPLHAVYAETPPSMPVTEDIAQRILCLPFSAQMTSEEVDRVCRCLG